MNECVEYNVQNESMECCEQEILNESKDSKNENFQNESTECYEQEILNESKDSENEKSQNESMECFEQEILNESKDGDKDSFLNESKGAKRPKKMSSHEIAKVTNEVTSRSDRLKNKPSISYNEDEINLNNFIMNAHTVFNEGPCSFDEVQSREDRALWEEAIKVDSAHKLNNTWTIVKMPKNKNIVD